MSTTTNTSDEQAPLFKPFTWVPSKDRADTGRYQLMSTIRDLASGVAVALELVERSELETQADGAPLIDGSVAMRLRRMSIAALYVIEGYIDEHFDDMVDEAARRRTAAPRRGAA
jgi:hypothetical protein